MKDLKYSIVYYNCCVNCTNEFISTTVINKCVLCGAEKLYGKRSITLYYTDSIHVDQIDSGKIQINSKDVNKPSKIIENYANFIFSCLLHLNNCYHESKERVRLMAARKTRTKIKDQYQGIQRDLDRIQERLYIIQDLVINAGSNPHKDIPVLVNMIHEVKKAFTLFREDL